MHIILKCAENSEKWNLLRIPAAYSCTKVLKIDFCVDIFKNNFKKRNIKKGI
jgi:hypothetical protein